jgi:hypothetical protein
MSDQWEVSGDCTAGAIVMVLNERTGVGAMFEDQHQTGFFTVTIEGMPCDPIQVWEDLDEELSSAASTQLETTVNGTSVNTCP